VKKIFAAIDDDREYAAIMFFLVTACREKEVAFAQWDDLKIIEGKPHYGCKRRLVSLPRTIRSATFRSIKNWSTCWRRTGRRQQQRVDFPQP